MTEEKKIILDKVNELIERKKTELLKSLPSIHEIDDGIIIRFFTKWDNCEDTDEIKYKKLNSLDDPDESVVFFYIPKDAYFDLKQRYYIGCITCLNGKIDITANNKTSLVESYSKMCVHSADVQGKAYENTYLLITSNRKDWGNDVREHVKANYQ
jgi:hypothetical protein